MSGRALPPVAAPEDREILAAEVSRHLPVTVWRGLEVRVTTSAESPAVMREIGRIREVEYRAEGAGRGVSRDVDALDTRRDGYIQLYVWDPEEREIVSMYRFIFGAAALAAEDLTLLRTSTLFRFSPEFVQTVLPVAVELGRSVVNRGARRALLGLFAVWAGLGALVVEAPGLRWFFGNVTIYPHWPAGALRALRAFLSAHAAGPAGLVVARDAPEPPYETDTRSPSARYAALPRSEALALLHDELRAFDLAPPPILLSYLRATDALETFDTVRDADFGGAWETALRVPTDRLTERTRERFIATYAPIDADRLRQHIPESLRGGTGR